MRVLPRAHPASSGACRQLQDFPLDGLKIDRTFIAGLGDNAEDGVVVTAAIAIARAFDLRVTAEGIETEGQLAELRLHCDQGQGYLSRDRSRRMPSFAS